MKPVCRTARFVPDGLPGTRLAERHRSICLHCQLDEARQRALLRDLAALRADVVPAPAWLHARVMARLGSQIEGPRGISRQVRRWVGGTAAAAAIGAAAVFGGLARRRARAAG